MKKFILDLHVVERQLFHQEYVLLKLTNPDAALPEMCPGQFAELRVDASKTTFLRRPISINFVDYERNEVWFLIRMIGDGTRALGLLREGDTLNAVLPLGNSFTMSGAQFPKVSDDASLLLVGGGVGTAPLLFLGSELKKRGYKPVFLLGARTAGDLLELEEFSKIGELFTTTEDGSQGERGFVVHHSVLQSRKFSWIYSCGPKPMMQAVAAYAAAAGRIPCEVSLENKMACGVGACLCCVENTKEGHKCVCKEGPVFNTEDLLWQN